MFSFDQIFGQDRAIGTIKRAYEIDRLPHAMVFAGPAGVGKATTALALSTLFLCAKPDGTLPCGKCESCRVMSAGTHPDYHVVTKELIRYHDSTGKSKGIDLSINVIRPEVIDKAAHKAVMNRGKVFVIEQAELMSTAAQNSLLKTLEEPAGRTLIILLTDQPGVLLTTIRSRCQLIQFQSLDDEVLRAELQSRNIPAPKIDNAIRYAGGSLGIAIKWLEDGVIARAVELEKMIDGILNGRSASDLPDWFKASADEYAEKQLERDELGSKDQATREGLVLYLKLSADRVRQKLMDETNPDVLERSCTIIDALARAEEFVDGNVNVALLFQQLSVAMER